MSRYLLESLEYKDMVGMMKPQIHVDEFTSKMGDDEDIVVISFFVRDRQAAEDLVVWFEKGYEWILDSDRSPGEIRPGRYLVFIEARRRRRLAQQLQELLEDLDTLTEYKIQDWKMHVNDQLVPWSTDTFRELVPLSPQQYRERQDQRQQDLNEVRSQAGIDPVRIYQDLPREIKTLQAQAGI